MHYHNSYHDKHIPTNKIDNFDPPATVPDVYMIKIPVIREGLKPFRIIPQQLIRVLHIVWALYYVNIVVEVTLNMTK